MSHLRTLDARTAIRSKDHTEGHKDQTPPHKIESQGRPDAYGSSITSCVLFSKTVIIFKDYVLMCGEF